MTFEKFMAIAGRARALRRAFTGGLAGAVGGWRKSDWGAGRIISSTILEGCEAAWGATAHLHRIEGRPWLNAGYLVSPGRKGAVIRRARGRARCDHPCAVARGWQTFSAF